MIAPLFGPAAGPVVDLYRALNSANENTIAESLSAQSRLGKRPRSVAGWLAAVGA